MESILYTRLVDKEEAKRIKKLRTIGIPSSSEQIKKLLGYAIKESKFSSDTIIGII